MNRPDALVTFVWEFVVGDDWTIAVGVVGALGITALVADVGSAWFVMPVAIIGLLGFSVWRAIRPPQWALNWQELRASDHERGSGSRTPR
jgi:hypothetical protein